MVRKRNQWLDDWNCSWWSDYWRSREWYNAVGWLDLGPHRLSWNLGRDYRRRCHSAGWSRKHNYSARPTDTWLNWRTSFQTGTNWDAHKQYDVNKSANHWLDGRGCFQTIVNRSVGKWQFTLRLLDQWSYRRDCCKVNWDRSFIRGQYTVWAGDKRSHKRCDSERVRDLGPLSELDVSRLRNQRFNRRDSNKNSADRNSYERQILTRGANNCTY